MKVQYVSIQPTESANNAGCFSLTPELLASVGARYSRNNEGLNAIVSKIDSKNLDKSVDSIFKMVDYGHASIADMTPIALFIDEISQFAAYYLWTLSPTAGGQECSTRYIKMDNSSIINSDALGIPQNLKKQFEDCFDEPCKYGKGTVYHEFFEEHPDSWEKHTKQFEKIGLKLSYDLLKNVYTIGKDKQQEEVSEDTAPAKGEYVVYFKTKEMDKPKEYKRVKDKWEAETAASIGYEFYKDDYLDYQWGYWPAEKWDAWVSKN